MGMYTKLTGDLILLPEAIPIIEAKNDWESKKNDWSDLALKWPWLEEWGKYSRADFIPFGSTYSDDDQYSKLEGNRWQFVCYLKNYDETIEYFFENILPRLAGSGKLEVLHEEAETPDVYTILNCKVILAEKGKWL